MENLSFGGRPLLPSISGVGQGVLEVFSHTGNNYDSVGASFDEMGRIVIRGRYLYGGVEQLKIGLSIYDRYNREKLNLLHWTDLIAVQMVIDSEKVVNPYHGMKSYNIAPGVYFDDLTLLGYIDEIASSGGTIDWNILIISKHSEYVEYHNDPTYNSVNNDSDGVSVDSVPIIETQDNLSVLMYVLVCGLMVLFLIRKRNEK